MSVQDLKFSNDHEWIKVEGGKAYIGISDYAQHALGDIVFVDLPDVGAKLSAGKVFGSIESVKAVSDFLSPVSGTVDAVNEALVDAPELLNEDAYENWILLVELDNPAELDALLDNVQYEEFCKNEGV